MWVAPTHCGCGCSVVEQPWPYDFMWDYIGKEASDHLADVEQGLNAASMKKLNVQSCQRTMILWVDLIYRKLSIHCTQELQKVFT